VDEKRKRRKEGRVELNEHEVSVSFSIPSVEAHDVGGSDGNLGHSRSLDDDDYQRVNEREVSSRSERERKGRRGRAHFLPLNPTA